MSYFSRITRLRPSLAQIPSVLMNTIAYSGKTMFVVAYSENCIPRYLLSRVMDKVKTANKQSRLGMI